MDMKKSLLLASLLSLAGLQAGACDSILKPFPRDCAIQDRYENIKNSFAAKKINVDEISEYRVLRFIERNAWEKAKANKTPITQIYKPAPETWQVWDQGIRHIFGTTSFKGELNKSFPVDTSIIGAINQILLTNGKDNVKDKGTDKKLQPGQYRVNKNNGVGFCSDGKVDNDTLLKAAAVSAERFQHQWEVAMGQSFPQMIEKALGIQSGSEDISFFPGMSVGYKNCDKNNNKSIFVNYLAPEKVLSHLKWVTVFLKENLLRAEQNRAVLSPIELAVFTQKWLISIHPFADGNGRTSRALEDAILAHFGMPFVPTGDLQDDTEIEYETYLENTYVKLEAMLGVLENCAALANQTAVDLPVQCKTVDQLL